MVAFRFFTRAGENFENFNNRENFEIFLRNTKIRRLNRIMTILETRKRETKTTTVTTVLTADRILTEALMVIHTLWFVFFIQELLDRKLPILGGRGILFLGGGRE